MSLATYNKSQPKEKKSKLEKFMSIAGPAISLADLGLKGSEMLSKKESGLDAINQKKK